MTISSELAFEIRQHGAQELSQSLVGVKGDIDDVTDATTRHGVATSKVTEFIHKQRTKQREQAFLFREGRSAMMLATSAMMMYNATGDDTSATNKKINTTVMQGIMGFQTADIAMAALGVTSGGTTAAIAALVAGGSALMGFLSSTNEEAKKAAQEGLKQVEERINKLSTAAATNEFLNTEIAIQKNRKALRDLESDEKNYFISTQNLPSGQTVQTRIMTMAAQERRKMYEDEIAFLKGGKEEIDKILKGRQDDNRALIGIINQEEYHVGQLQLKVKEAGIYEDILKRQYDLSLAQTNLDRARAGEGPLSWETLNAGDMAMLRMRMNMGMVRADADAFWKKFNQETSKMAGQGAALLQMPEVNALGQKQLAIQLLQKELYYTDDITGNLKKQEILRSEMKFLMMSTTEKTQMEMNALSTGLNAAQQGMALFGIQSDSVIGKLIQMVQLAQTLAELISALNFLGLFSGGTSAVTTVLKYGGVVTLPKTTPGGRKQLMKLIADSERKGFSY